MSGERREGSTAGVFQVVIGDCCDVVRYGIAGLLERDPRFQISKATKAFPCEPFRIVIVDTTTPWDAREITLRSAPDTATVALEFRPSRGRGMAWLAAGWSCISWAVPAAAIVSAFRSVADRRQVFLGPKSELVERSQTDRPLLTARELSVLQHLGERRPQSEIARALGIRPETVRRHASSIRRKLGLENRRDLIGVSLSNPAAPALSGTALDADALVE